MTAYYPHLDGLLAALIETPRDRQSATPNTEKRT
jgi:hypothetical protein